MTTDNIIMAKDNPVQQQLFSYPQDHLGKRKLVLSGFPNNSKKFNADDDRSYV